MNSTNDRALAALRIAVGLLFVCFGQYKVSGTGFVSAGFTGWIQRFIEDGAYPFMLPVLKGFVLPHARAIAVLVAYGELAIGVSLTVGVLSRFASVFGAIYMMTLLFSSNWPGAQVPLWQYFGASLNHLVLALCFAAFALGEPQRAWALARSSARPRRAAS
jgi:uncharacterized membrane protein YphA (DoxX/SURF4 family)